MKFSVIVPVYGAEKYLDACVGSVLAQTFTDFELILVDDCSPDNCGAMCDAYARQDSRVRVIHQKENQGMGVARNTGLAHAAGEYILFMDSDDWVDKDMMDACAGHLSDGTDILCLGAIFSYEDKRGQVSWTETLQTDAFCAEQPENIAQAFALLNRQRIFQFVWNKCYRRQLLCAMDASFEKTLISEDLFYNLQAFSAAKKIKLLDGAFYHYRKPAHETMANKYHPEFFQICRRKYREELRFLQGCGADTPEYRQLIQTSYIKHFISAIIRNRSKKALLSRKERLARIRGMLADELTQEILRDYVPQGLKLRVIAFAMRHKMARTCSLIGLSGEFAQTNMKVFFKKYLIR